MKVFRSNPNLRYSQILRCWVRVSPPNLSFLENSTKDATFGPKTALFWENLVKTSELLSSYRWDPLFSDLFSDWEQLPKWVTFKLLSFIGCFINFVSLYPKICNILNLYSKNMFSFFSFLYKICSTTAKMCSTTASFFIFLHKICLSIFFDFSHKICLGTIRDTYVQTTFLVIS